MRRAPIFAALAAIVALGSASAREPVGSVEALPANLESALLLLKSDEALSRLKGIAEASRLDKDAAGMIPLLIALVDDDRIVTIPDDTHVGSHQVSVAKAAQAAIFKHSNIAIPQLRERLFGKDAAKSARAAHLLAFIFSYDPWFGPPREMSRLNYDTITYDTIVPQQNFSASFYKMRFELWIATLRTPLPRTRPDNGASILCATLDTVYIFIAPFFKPEKLATVKPGEEWKLLEAAIADLKIPPNTHAAEFMSHWLYDAGSPTAKPY